ncbi:hypothetical protein SAMN05660420_03094 [Desulfuromusa kysingii]|uniref:Uncharacterized protein n=1 Tax=Desulfuromusa kysingii TaxID=37625 RepID=A0A1H4DU22_9BACT|nr:hypothetical protein [Desulfuromusa kysingii]SEA75702.1 hypothetical protein SAMN05660420_03094 [Desulfuromusa kysingii]
MTSISKTILATHDPASIADDEGSIPYDDEDSLSAGTVSFRVKHTENNYPLEGVFKIKTTLDMPGSIGFGKTAWGATLQAEIEVDDDDPDSAALTITDDTFVAGRVIGLDLSPEFHIDVSHIHYHWLSHSWDHIKTFDKGPYQFNAVAFIALIVGKLVTLGDAIPLGDIIAALLPENVDTGAYYDKTSGIGAKNGKVSLAPKVVGDVDLVGLVLTISEDVIRAIFLPTGPGELVVDLILALGDVVLTLVDFVNPQLAFGPSFGFASPVDINITDFSVADSSFTVQDADINADTTILYGQGDGNGALPADLSDKDVSVSFHAHSEYDLLGGGFIQISWLKVLSLEKRVVKTIVNEGESVRDSTFYNTVGAQDLDGSSVDKGYLENVVN